MVPGRAALPDHRDGDIAEKEIIKVRISIENAAHN